MLAAAWTPEDWLALAEGAALLVLALSALAALVYVSTHDRK